VDARGLLSFVCRRAPGRSARHHALNDLVAWCFASAGTPVTKEPTGLFRTEGKRPDGLTLVPWQSGKSLCWDVTFICLLAESYVTGSVREAGAAAELAASRKEENMPALEAIASLRLSRSKPWARWTHRHANCLPIWEERSPRRQAMTEKELFCSREFRCWCSATTLYCQMTPCQPLTARTDDLYPFVYYLNF